ncbi:MAG: hypothetical protein SH817_07475 [Leptospira sp.]|nr:hypothetical protein [Leptospira sp.]
MKKKMMMLKNKNSMNIVHFIHQTQKYTTFTFSKWNTLQLNAKIQMHGCLSTYIDFLIDRYSFRVYETFKFNKIALDQEAMIHSEEKMRIKCRIFESTLDELSELAEYAMMNKTKLFRILLKWDINNPSPRLRLIA